MKRITLLFIAIIACILTATAQTDTIEVRQSATDTQIEYIDTPAAKPVESSAKRANDDNFSFDFGRNFETVIPVLAILCVFGLPVIVVFIIFYFRYKSKKAKYGLAEQALAAGQPIPEEYFRERSGSNILQKGITNAFTGIGLFIFLWAITEEFSIGCIGLLIMFMGFGQIVIHYTNDKKKDSKKPGCKDNNSPNEE